MNHSWRVRFFSRTDGRETTIAYVPLCIDAAMIAQHYASEYGHGIDICDGSAHVATAYPDTPIDDLDVNLRKRATAIAKANEKESEYAYFEAGEPRYTRPDD